MDSNTFSNSSQDERKLSLKEKNQTAFAVYQELLKWKTLGGLSYLKIGQLLKRIKEEELYKELGYEDYEFFLKSPEVKIDLRKAYYLIQIWTTFCEKYKIKEEELSEIPWTCLRVILPIVREGNVRNLLEKAKQLSRADLESEVKALRKGISTLEELNTCKHEWEEIRYWRCRICGTRSKTKPEDGTIVG